MGSDPSAQPIGDSTAQQLQALTANLPQLMTAINGQILPSAQANQAAQTAIAPQQAALMTQLFGQYGPQLNQIGNTINAQNALASASSDNAVLNGPGKDLLASAKAADMTQDPEYYATRALTSSRLGDLLNSININGLSGSERAEVERANAQSGQARGIANTPSQTATVENAMNFGSALQQKRNALGQAIGAATSFLPASRSGTDVFQVATGKPSTGNQGAGQFQGLPQNLGGDVTNLASSLFSGINANSINAQNINANRRDTLDKVNGTLSSLPT